MNKQKVVIILPTYNERENIESIIHTLEEEIFPSISDYAMHILVADDNSPDGTAEIVKKLIKKYKNLEISQGPKKGLGAAYIRGMNYAIEEMGADILFEMDADGQHDPTKVAQFLKKIDEGCDMVIGTRYSKGGSIPKNWPIQRKLFSITANLFVRTVFMRFNVHDWTGGYRALKKEVFLKEKKELANYNGYIFQISFLHKAVRDGFKIGEVPFHFTDRTLGKSKIAPLGYIFDVLYFVITARIQEIMFGRFGKFFVVGFSGLFINLTTYFILANYTHISLVASNTVGAQLAIFSNYNLNNLWTFGNKRTKTVGSYFFKMMQFFLTSNIGVWLFQNGTIYVGEKNFGREHYLIYFGIGTAILLVWNFTIYNKFIWRE
ncbi:MAG: glycosyltransferase [Candidatus Levybacteria bacterium]|nr:glycosyltransferase [Candidatus Levybacteria bacterium]